MRVTAAWTSSCAFCAGYGSEDVFDFHGEFYTVDRQGLPLKSVQLPHPPIYAGTRNETGKEVIARDGDYWFVDYQTDYRMWERNIEQAAVFIADMRRRAARHGRDYRFRHVVSCHLRRYDRGGGRPCQSARGTRQDHANRVAFIAAKALGPGLVGTPEPIADRIRRYEAAGVGTLMMHFHPDDGGHGALCPPGHAAAEPKGGLTAAKKRGI